LTSKQSDNFFVILWIHKSSIHKRVVAWIHSKQIKVYCKVYSHVYKNTSTYFFVGNTIFTKIHILCHVLYRNNAKTVILLNNELIVSWMNKNLAATVLCQFTIKLYEISDLSLFFWYYEKNRLGTAYSKKTLIEYLKKCYWQH